MRTQGQNTYVLKGLTTVACVTVLGGLIWATAGAWAQDQAGSNPQPAAIKNTLGSGAYTTTQELHTNGELSAENFRQVSTLASQIVNHLGAATDSLAEEDTQHARSELEHARTLSKVIRDLLPTTKVTTVVRDQKGKEVYRYEDQIQDDQIPLFDDMVAVDVLQSVIDKKKEEKTLEGMRLADAELIHTSAMLDLTYVDRKVSRALNLLSEKPVDALAELFLANTRGVRFAVDRLDDPLVKAQEAIRVAERMAAAGKHEAADENLELARLHLETYRSLLGEEDQGAVKTLQQEIQSLAGKTDQAGSTKQIRGFWDRVTSWFHRKPGQAHVTVDKPLAKRGHAGDDALSRNANHGN